MSRQCAYIWDQPNKWQSFQVLSLPNHKIQQVSIGEKHAIFRSDHGIYGYGNNCKGQLGLDQYEEEAKQIMPIHIKNLCNKIVMVSCGWSHSLALDQFGNVYGTGEGKNGALGFGRGIDSFCFKPISDLRNIKFISAGKDHSLALSSIKVYGWGNSLDGQLGIPKQKICFQPQQLYLYPSRICYAGPKYSIFVTEKGVYATGLNQFGQLGFGNKIKIKLPKKINFGEEEIISISGSSCYSVFQTASGQFYLAGSGCLGEFLYPTKIKPFRNCQQLMISQNFGIAKAQSNTYFSWDAKKDHFPQQNKTLTNFGANQILVGPSIMVCLAEQQDRQDIYSQAMDEIHKRKGVRNQVMAKSSIQYCYKPNQNNQAYILNQLKSEVNEKKPRKQSEALQSRNFPLDQAWQSVSRNWQPNQTQIKGFYTEMDWQGKQSHFVDENDYPYNKRKLNKQDISSPHFRKDFSQSRELDRQRQQPLVTNRISQYQYQQMKQLEHKNRYPQRLQAKQYNPGSNQNQNTINLKINQSHFQTIQKIQMKERLQFLESQSYKKDDEIRQLRREIVELVEFIESDAALKKIVEQRQRASLLKNKSRDHLAIQESPVDIFTKNSDQLKNMLSKALSYVNSAI